MVFGGYAWYDCRGYVDGVVFVYMRGVVFCAWFGCGDGGLSLLVRVDVDCVSYSEVFDYLRGDCGFVSGFIVFYGLLVL